MSIRDYVANLELSEQPSRLEIRERSEASAENPLPADRISANLKAAVDGGSVISFVENVPVEQKNDILMSTLFAQRAANAAHDRFAETEAWYGMYTQVLSNIGWVVDQFAFTRKSNERGEFRMDRAALAVIAAIATQNQLGILTEGLKALEALADDKNQITIFDFNTSVEFSGNFQLGAAEVAPNDAVSLCLGGFYFRNIDRRRRFLFFGWGAQHVNFWTAAQDMTLNEAIYARLRDVIAERLAATAGNYIDSLPLG